MWDALWLAEYACGPPSLLTRSKLDPNNPTEGISLSWRVQEAQAGLQSLLRICDVDEAVHVGFEVLVPALLHQVEQFNTSTFQDDGGLRNFKESK